MPQHVSGRGWRVAAWCRAGILDVVTAAIGVGILALPFLSVDVIVTEGRAFLGRDVALEPWVALPVMAAYAVLGGIYIACANFGLLPRLVLAALLIGTGLAGVMLMVVGAFVLAAAAFMLPAFLLTIGSVGFLPVLAVLLWAGLFFAGPPLVATMLGSDLTF